jgi:hypothetical protein
MTEPQPTPPPAAPAYVPAPVKRRSPTGWTVTGIVLLVLSLFSFPRGLLGLIATIAQGGNVAYALGYFMFGAALVTVGIVLLVTGARIRKANRLVDGAAAAPPS